MMASSGTVRPIAACRTLPVRSPGRSGTGLGSSACASRRPSHGRPAVAAKERKILRCAVYTRKSSEHGLEQDFNSLDAQREAGEAYIKIQAHEGWRLIKTHYDDGGLSGGSMERPALGLGLNTGPLLSVAVSASSKAHAGAAAGVINQSVRAKA